MGNGISAEGVTTDPDKVAAIYKWDVPKDIKALQAFLETAGYYRQYLLYFATITRPLAGSFQRLKDDFISAPTLGCSNSKLLYILDTDASMVRVGVVLSQVQKKKK